MKSKKRFLVLFIFLSYFSYSNDTTTDTITTVADISDVKETLTYGIEAEVLNFIKSLNEPLSDEYMTLIVNRYNNSVLTETKIGMINYFVRCNTISENIVSSLFNDAQSELIDRQIKANIFYALAKHGNEEHYNYLFKQLDSDDKVVLSSASNAINRIKNKSVAPLILKKLQDATNDPEIVMQADVRNNLILSLGALEYKEAAPYLREILKDDPTDTFLVMYTMFSLAQLADIESIPLIRKRLTSSEKKIKDYAAYSLSSFKDISMLDIYKDMLLHNDATVRVYGCRGVVTNQFTSLIDILLYRFNKDPDNNVKNEALKSLVLLKNDGITAIKETMKNKKYNYSHYYVVSETLIKDPSQENIDFTLELYKSADKTGKEIIAKNIVKSQSNLIDPLINELLSSPDYLIRLGAINAILSITDTTLESRLKEISETDGVATVKKTASKVLLILGSKK